VLEFLELNAVLLQQGDDLVLGETHVAVCVCLWLEWTIKEQEWAAAAAADQLSLGKQRARRPVQW
jgi:hypothetical protein